MTNGSVISGIPISHQKEVDAMKKSGKILTFSAAMLASAGLSGCSKVPAELAKELYNIFMNKADNYDPGDNIEEDIYAGPDFYDDYYGEENIESVIYAGPDFYEDYSGEDNVEEVLYAGPDFFDDPMMGPVVPDTGSSSENN